MAPRTDAAKGWVKDEPKPFLPQHNTRKWSFDKNTGCWLWNGGLNKDGYGRIHVDSEHRLAHRVFYELKVSPLDRDHQLSNTCGTRSCVNPEHWVPYMEKSTRTCITCERTLGVQDFRIRVKSRGWRSSQCEKCRFVTSNHDRRSFLRNAESDGAGPYQVWNKSKGQCHLCGKQWRYEDYGHSTWHIEHVRPLSKSGSDLLDNKEVACAECNWRKGTNVH